MIPSTRSNRVSVAGIAQAVWRGGSCRMPSSRCSGTLVVGSGRGSPGAFRPELQAPCSEEPQAEPDEIEAQEERDEADPALTCGRESEERRFAGTPSEQPGQDEAEDLGAGEEAVDAVGPAGDRERQDDERSSQDRDDEREERSRESGAREGECAEQREESQIEGQSGFGQPGMPGDWRARAKVGSRPFRRCDEELETGAVYPGQARPPREGCGSAAEQDVRLIWPAGEGAECQGVEKPDESGEEDRQGQAREEVPREAEGPRCSPSRRQRAPSRGTSRWTGRDSAPSRRHDRWCPHAVSRRRYYSARRMPIRVALLAEAPSSRRGSCRVGHRRSERTGTGWGNPRVLCAHRPRAPRRKARIPDWPGVRGAGRTRQGSGARGDARAVSGLALGKRLPVARATLRAVAGRKERSTPTGEGVSERCGTEHLR